MSCILTKRDVASGMTMLYSLSCSIHVLAMSIRVYPWFYTPCIISVMHVDGMYKITECMHQMHQTYCIIALQDQIRSTYIVYRVYNQLEYSVLTNL